MDDTPHFNDRARHQWVSLHILPHVREVRGWLRRNVRSLNSADIDDLVQEAFSRLWSSEYRHITNGRSYLYATLSNLLMEQARRARIVPMERIGEIEALRLPSNEPGPERKISARQELQNLEHSITRLPEQCRRAFELHRFHGLTYQQIAAEMGVTKKTVEKHLALALARLMQAHREHTHDPASPEQPGIRHDSERSKD